MRKYLILPLALIAFGSTAAPLGLPEVPIPADNPQSDAKIALGEKLFTDTRFSATGEVSCSTCHDPKKAFTDSPLQVSEGIEGLTGTRNAPTVLNAAYNRTQFWDGRSPSLEDQARHPFVNPVEMGLRDHQPILDTIAGDDDYRQAFQEVFGKSGDQVSMDEVLRAIAAFERTRIAGDSPFDRFWFGGDESALTEAQKRGFDVFMNQGRCVACHTIEQDHALFTDHKFHNIGVGVNDLGDKVAPLAQAFLKAKAEGIDVDVAVLSDADTSHLGRFAVSDELSDLGGFKTPTLRNVDLTAPTCTTAVSTTCAMWSCTTTTAAPRPRTSRSRPFSAVQCAPSI
ncbi:cytochrome-c peroxidase [Marinobacterium aestuariivivens]|uniref:Cytochrome-c peroxidase n=1 Tax=Marinobacterium aestuariivivens TaxID=1698799 RepID=A0ABW2A438_9GAMM